MAMLCNLSAPVIGVVNRSRFSKIRRAGLLINPSISLLVEEFFRRFMGENIFCCDKLILRGVFMAVGGS